MSGSTDVLADLQGVVRIAKAASLGVTGNKPRIERAEQAIAAVAELIGFVQDCADGRPEAEPSECRKRAIDLLARIGGSK